MLKKLTIIFLISLFPLCSFANTDYDIDEADYYVSEQQINEQLEQINIIICFMKNTSPNAFVNAGNYSANIYEDECQLKADTSTDQSQAQPVSAANATSSSSSSQENNSEKKATNAIVQINRESLTSAVTSNVWVFLTDNDIEMPNPSNPNQMLTVDKMTVYGFMEQTAAATATNPKGNFEFYFNYILDKDDTGTADNMNIGSGYLKAAENTVIMKENSFGDELNILANFDSSNNSNFDGIYSIVEYTGQNSGYILYNQFQNSAATNVYCEQIVAADSFTMLPNANSEGEFIDKTEITDLNTLPVQFSTTKKCYSTNKTTAKKNVWRYGVYNQDGSRATITNPSFPIKTSYTHSDSVIYEIRGWASYYGVHVDTYNLPSGVDPTTLTFKKESYANTQQSTDTYSLQAVNVRVEKIEANLIALNKLDKIKIAMYLGDPYFQTEYNNLNANLEMNKEYIGSYDKTNSTFTFTHTIDWSSGYNKTELGSPIEFTSTQYITAMTKDSGQEWEWTKPLGVWSSETHTWYEITKESMQNPDSDLLRIEENSFVDPSTLTSTTLVCIEDCITSTALDATYNDVSSKIAAESTDHETTNIPFNSTPSLFDNNNWVGAVADTDLITYTFNNSGENLDSVSNQSISIPSSITTMSDKEELYNYYFTHPQHNYNRQLGWGISTGELIDQSDLAKLECKKESDGTYVENSYDTLKTNKSASTIYCEEELRTTINIRYRVMFETWTNYKLLDANSNLVAFDAPKTLELVVPAVSSIATDYHSKTYQLNFEDFDQLHGLPGYVYDTATGDNLGEYISGSWEESYRYINAFTIPDGTELTDKSTSPATTYKVKALDGEEFLSTASAENFTNSYTKADLPNNNVLKDISSSSSSNFIGDVPTDLLCDGTAIVTHGTVSYSPNVDGTTCPE